MQYVKYCNVFVFVLKKCLFICSETEKFRAGVGEQVSMCGYLAGSVAAGAGIAMLYGWQLTLVALAVVPLSILQATLVSKVS